MKLTKDKILQALLLSINEPKYLNYFPHNLMHHYSTLGYTATTKMDSQIRILLEVQAKALIDQLCEYELPEPKKLGRVEKRAIERAAKAEREAKLKADQERFTELEQAWKEDKPRADKEMLDNATKAAENIFNKNQELKKTRA